MIPEIEKYRTGVRVATMKARALLVAAFAECHLPPQAKPALDAMLAKIDAFERSEQRRFYSALRRLRRARDV